MTDPNASGAPEPAANEVLPGDSVEVNARDDGRWVVVIRSYRGVLYFDLCKRADDDEGWIVVDSGEMVASPESLMRSTWISLLEPDDPGSNVGVDIAWGIAPSDVNSGVLRGAAGEFDVSALNGTYWLVRWEVSDPMESDDDEDDADDFEFARACPRRFLGAAASLSALRQKEQRDDTSPDDCSMLAQSGSAPLRGCR